MLMLSCSSPAVDRGRKAVEMLFDLKKFIGPLVAAQTHKHGNVWDTIYVRFIDHLF